MDQIDKAVKFTETYKRYEHEHPAIREAMCLKAQYPAILDEIQDEDLFAGRVSWPAVGFMLSEMGYYCREKIIQAELDKTDLPQSDRNKLLETLNYWKSKAAINRIRSKGNLTMPPETADTVKCHDSEITPIIAECLYRVSGVNLDFSKLLRLGILGMIRELEDYKKTAVLDGNDPKLYEGMRICLELLSEVCRHYAVQAKDKAIITVESKRKTELESMSDALEKISSEPPETMYEAIQLFWLYARLADTYNFGRMDLYLADYYVRDVESRRVDDAQALYILQSLWRLIADTIGTPLGRIFIGGYGRPNEKSADKFALLALEASRTVRKVLPQLSLRLYKGMNSRLFAKALDVIGEGCVFPMLYNDDINIPAFQNVFGVNHKEAEQYIVSDCGEFGLDHSSIGLPNGIFNMAKVLEVTLHNGVDPGSGKAMGLQAGTCSDFRSFEDLWNAYARQTEYSIDVLLTQLAPMYPVLKENTYALFAAMLTDDCLKKGAGLFSGVRYKGLLIEIYGTISVADSLVAIKQAVYDQKKIKLDQLAHILDANFIGYEKERHLLRNAPKYGNDNALADEMAIKVYRHICAVVKSYQKRLKLDFCLADLINAGGHITLGKQVGALPDGRAAGLPLSNANNPSPGNDRTGPTALLNSLVKLHPSEIGGQVQYLKFNRDLFTQSRTKLEALLKTYFDNGGSQAMITVVNRDDLKNAMKEPGKYGDLTVRIGGFCAQFVSLSRDFQEEIIARTLQS